MWDKVEGCLFVKSLPLSMLLNVKIDMWFLCFLMILDKYLVGTHLVSWKKTMWCILVNKVLASFFKMPDGILCFGSIPPNTLKNLEGFHISIIMFFHPLEASYDVIVEEPQPNCCWFNLGNLFVKGNIL